MTRTVTLIVSLLGLLAIAGCGTSTTTTVVTTITQTTTTSAASSATATPTTTSPTTTGSSSTQTRSSAAPAACRASDLTLSFLGQQGATGHGEIGFALKNTSRHTCTTIGYPGVLFLDKAGKPLPTIPHHTTHDLFGTAPFAPLTVPAGESVSFRLGVTHGLSSTAGCSTAYGLQVIPPNDTATLRVLIADGAYQCQRATVSPVQPGDRAYP